MSSEKLVPYKLDIPNLEFLAREIVEGSLTGLHRSPFHGFSAEFREHKMYVPGESVKFIDWKVYARSEKLYIKKFDEETNLRVHLILDASSSMYYPPRFRFDLDNLNKIGFSAVAAAVLIELFRRQRDAAGMSVFSENIDVSLPEKTNAVHRQLLYAKLEELLKNPEGNRQTGFARNLHLIAESLKRRSLTVLFTDLWLDENTVDAGLDALKHLRYKSAEMIVFHVLDARTEKEFLFENRPVRFVDTETGEKLNLYPQEIRKHYLEKQREYFNRFRELFYDYGIDYVPVDVAEGYTGVISAYLQKRLRMK